MCKAAKDPVRQQAAQKFTAVVLQLRKCNKDSLKMLVDNMLKKQDPIERYRWKGIYMIQQERLWSQSL